MIPPLGLMKRKIHNIQSPPGTVLPWYPSGGANQNIRCCYAITENTLFVGGDFTTIGGQPRNYICAIDMTTGEVLPWYPPGGADNIVTALHVSGNTLFVGGNFTTLGGQSRDGICAIDTTTGQVTSWYPPGGVEGTGTIFSLHAVGNSLFVGGNFSLLGGLERPNIGAVDLISGATTSWQITPNVNFASGPPNNQVRWITHSNDLLYIGGDFTTMGGIIGPTRNRICAIEIFTGFVSTWYPPGGANGNINVIEIFNNTMYVGGFFTTLGGQARNRIGAINMTTGTVTSWYPPGGANSTVFTLLPQVGTNILYVGGFFTTLGGQTRNRIGAIDMTTGAVTSWYPTNGADNTVSRLAQNLDALYVTGNFATLGGQIRNRIGAIKI